MTIIFRFWMFLLFAGLSLYGLYKHGRVEEARAAYRADLERTAMAKDQRVVWQSYMSLAEFESELSEFRAAIEHGNKALEIATELNEPFMAGLSFCRLGSAYSALGMYEAALSFYGRALEIGAPGDQIFHQQIWSTATQQIGLIRFKMTDTKGAKELLQKSYAYALANKIDADVAEAATYLAEIALHEKKFADAEKFAHRAVETAKRVDCSSPNYTRTRFIAAKAELERSRFNPAKMVKTRETLDTLLDDCEKLGHTHCVAETKLLLSKTLLPEQSEERSALVESAYETLVASESERRATASAEIGRIYLETTSTPLADFYANKGLKTDADVLRKVDRTYTALNLDELSGKLERDPEKAAQLLASWQAAKKTNALPLILESQMKLTEVLEANRYLRAAFDLTKDAINTADRLVRKNPEKSWERKHFKKLRLQLSEQALAYALELRRGTQQ